MVITDVGCALQNQDQGAKHTTKKQEGGTYTVGACFDA